MRTCGALIVAATLALAGRAGAGQVWTDGDGDGLPENGPLPTSASTNVTVGVWIDAQSFNWTNFLVYVEHNNDCLTYVSASYVISGTVFPIDDDSNPNAIGFGASGFSQGGIDQIGNITYHIDVPIGCCVTPIIDIYNPYDTVSLLGNAQAYMLFTSNPRTCYGSEPPPIEDEACCFPNGACQNRPADDCLEAGGVPQEEGTVCGPGICPPPPPPPSGACCYPDGTCVVRTPAACINGLYQGDGVSCEPSPCEPAEACCFPGGSCGNFTPTRCAIEGGVSQGPGTTCAGVDCPQPPTGACCYAGPCDEITESACDARGGVYLGDGTKCGPPFNPCPPLAVESKSWGGIKRLYR